MTAEPLYFGPDDRPLFGWLHRAPTPVRLGLVVCNPFGYESVCAHRSLRHFALASAAAGVPALRFDYDGTGDSAGDDRDPGRLAAWVASARSAADRLRRVGADRVVFLGVRLGALVAALAGAERDDVEGLIAIAPVVAGKAYLRELRALQMAMGLGEPPGGAVVEDGVQEALGFRLGAETRAALGEIDLSRSERPPAPAVLVIERDDLPGADAWPERLAALGAKVERRRLPGYADMMLGAQDAVVPEAMVSAATAWLREHNQPAPVPGPPASLGLRAPAQRTFQGVVERAGFVDDSGRLFGILSTPPQPPPSRRGLLLLNAGAVHRIGPNRLYVELARRWARLGHAVLRLDVSGIGDSRPRPGEPENVVYTDAASEDVAAGIAFLRRQPGVSAVTAIGLCSGGYNAFKAAVAGVPLDGVVLINPLTFFYKPGMSLDPMPEHEVRFEAQRYGRRLYSRAGISKLLRGEVHVRAVGQVMARRAAQVVRDQARVVARRLGVDLGDDLALELEAVARRKIALYFLFAGNDPGIGLLHSQGGATVEKLRRRGELGIDVIDGANHTFTPLWSHQPLIEALARQVEGPPRTR